MSAPPAYGNYGQAGTATQPNVPFSNPQSKIELKVACRYSALNFHNIFILYSISGP